MPMYDVILTYQTESQITLTVKSDNKEAAEKRATELTTKWFEDNTTKDDADNFIEDELIDDNLDVIEVSEAEDEAEDEAEAEE